MPKLTSTSPIFAVSDLARSRAYYTEVLVFDEAFVWGEPPFYAVMRKDAASIHLSQDRDGRAGTGVCYLGCEGVDELYEGIVARQGAITEPIGDRPYGMRDFSAADPDGNLISFGQDID